MSNNMKLGTRTMSRLYLKSVYDFLLLSWQIKNTSMGSKFEIMYEDKIMTSQINVEV